MSAVEVTDAAIWNDVVNSCLGNPLQLWGWGELKAHHNWEARRFAVYDNDELIGGFQVIFRSIPIIKRKLAYIPRGPFAKPDKWLQVLGQVPSVLKQVTGVLGVVIEPDMEGQSLASPWRPSSQTILMHHTLRLDLTQSEDQLLEAIDTKRRYDIRKSTKNLSDIRVLTKPDEIDQVLTIYEETAQRAGFGLHGRDYYRDIVKYMQDNSVIIGACNGDNVVAFTWYAVSHSTAFELYGGIDQHGQRLRANYGLKWWGITHFKQAGVRTYDFNGLVSDGVSNFKRSFAKHENDLIGTYTYSFSPLFTVWWQLQPLAKRIVRLLARMK